MSTIGVSCCSSASPDVLVLKGRVNGLHLSIFWLIYNCRKWSSSPVELEVRIPSSSLSCLYANHLATAWIVCHSIMMPHHSKHRSLFHPCWKYSLSVLTSAFKNFFKCDHDRRRSICFYPLIHPPYLSFSYLTLSLKYSNTVLALLLLPFGASTIWLQLFLSYSLDYPLQVRAPQHRRMVYHSVWWQVCV